MKKISSDYSGSRSDLYHYSSTEDNKSFLGIFKFQSYASKIAGPLKAAQNYIKVMLTPLGERKDQPTAGTNFVKELSSSTLFYPIQVEHAFARNNLYALSFIKSNYTEQTPRDEAIKRVVLISFTRENMTSLNFTIAMELESGEDTVIKLPVRTS